MAAPSTPRFLTATIRGISSVQLDWQPSLSGDASSYEVQLDEEEWISHTATEAKICGLNPGHRYSARVRARNADGTSDATPRVAFICDELVAHPIVSGQSVPLLDLLRQSVILRIQGIDVRMAVAWQPVEQRWYASIDIPIGTPVVRGKGVVTGSGLLQGLITPLPGDFVCRAKVANTEPGKNAWGGTHTIRWEAA